MKEQELQRQQQQQQQQQKANIEEQSPQVEVNREQTVVAAEMPAFSGPSSDVGSGVAVAANYDNFESSSQSPSQSSSSSSSSASQSSKSKSSLLKTITTTTTTTQQLNQEQPRVARLQQVRVHTVPLSEAVHYANYVVLPPAVAATKAAKLEDVSSSSSHKSSSSSSSSSTIREETESAAVAPPATTVVLPPMSSPDCQVLQRLIVERPLNSGLVVGVPSEVSLSQQVSSVHSARIVESGVEPPAEVPPVCCVVKKVAPVLAAKMVVQPPANDGHLKEEHFHTESRSSREESHGLGHVSSSSSSSSSSSRSSKSSTSTSSQTAALIAPPVSTVTVVRQAQPVLAVKAAPLVSLSNGHANTYSVDVDHHYNGPNVKYGYSIKQHSSEPETKGLLVGDRVVYLK